MTGNFMYTLMLRISIEEQLENGLIYIIALAVIIGLFLIIRRLILWYYKIDVRIENQNEIIRELKKLNRDNEESETDD
jgi:hypothetical protein